MNEETLTFYYYEDGLSDAERREVENALKSDVELAGRYRDLCRELDGIGSVEASPAPPHLVARWHDAIDREAARNEVAKQSSRNFHFGSFFWGTAVAASLAIGIAIGVNMTGRGIDIVDPGVTAVNTVSPGGNTSTALSRGLLVHFEDSKNQLASLAPDANGDRSLLIMDIIHQNRLFERVAARNDAPDLARLLRAFEPVLMRLAAEDLSPEDAAAIQAQLAFELNIVLTKLAQELSNDSDSIDI